MRIPWIFATSASGIASSNLSCGISELLGPPGGEQGGGAGGREVEGGRGGAERRARRSRSGEGLEALHFEARGGYR